MFEAKPFEFFIEADAESALQCDFRKAEMARSWSWNTANAGASASQTATIEKEKSENSPILAESVRKGTIYPSIRMTIRSPFHNIDVIFKSVRFVSITQPLSDADIFENLNFEFADVEYRYSKAEKNSAVKAAPAGVDPMTPNQALLIEGIVEPLDVYSWVAYSDKPESVTLSNEKLIGIKSLMFRKPIGPRSPQLFQMCRDNVEIPWAKFAFEDEFVRLSFHLHHARIARATLEGQALISKYGSESIHLSFQTLTFAAETKGVDAPSTPSEIFQNYAELRDEEEERELREKVLGNYRE